MEIYVVFFSEEQLFTEYDHAYVYITKYRYVIRRYYLLCETLAEHPTSAAGRGEGCRPEQKYKRPGRREGNGYTTDLSLGEQSEFSGKSGIY